MAYKLRAEGKIPRRNLKNIGKTLASDYPTVSRGERQMLAAAGKDGLYEQIFGKP
jgi:hypothetical protein